MDSKVIGYLLLALGLILVIVSLFSVYQVFTGRAQPVKLFNQSAISFDPTSLLAGQLPEGLTQKQSVSVELLSAKSLNDMFNLGSYIVLMTFISGLGAKIATIGTQLIRPIEVKLQTVQAKEPQSK